MDETQDWSVAGWQLDPPFVKGVRHVHTPLCGDHPRVVAGVGNCDESVSVLQWAGREAQLRGTQLHVVNAWEPGGFRDRVQRNQRQRQANRLMRQTLARAFPQRPVQVEQLTVCSGPAEVLAAASHGAALLVVGSHRRGVFGSMLKPVAPRGAALTTCPVAIVREGQPGHPRSGKVAVGIDDCLTCRDALRWAATEALYRDAELKVVLVASLPPRTTPGDLPHDEGQVPARILGETLVGPLARVRASIDPEPGHRHTVGGMRDGEQRIGVLLARAADADLLVMGSHGYGTSSGGVTGPVTNDCLDEATCPVIIIPASRDAERYQVRNADPAMERGTAPAPGPTGSTVAPLLPDTAGPADHAGLETLPLEVCLRLLESVPVGRVSVHADGEVVTLPVNHVVDGQDVIFRTDRGSKLSAAERRDLVGFEADDYDPRTRTGWSVLVKGHAEMVHEDSEIERLSRLGLHPWVTATDRPFWIRIRPTSVTGRHTPLTASR